MPCQFCSSSDHTLGNCNSPFAINMSQIVENFILQNKFKIQEQINYLRGLTKTSLAFINKKLNQTYNGCKDTLVYTIIRTYFRNATQHDQFHLITAADMLRIHNTYTEFYHQYTFLQSPLRETQMLPMNIKSMLDAFYEARYGVRRHGSSIEMYFEQLNQIARISPQQLSFYERELRENLVLRQEQVQEQVQEPEEIVNADVTLIVMFRRLVRSLLSPQNNQQSQPNAHLKKLNFCIGTDKSLEKAKECFICSDERPHAKLGCSHEYCIDCLFGTAKVRTKSFISCAVCRDEINVVKVGADDIKVALLRRLSEV
jgi:hypothetical protein